MEENGSGMRSWETIKRSLKIAAGCAGVAVAMFAAYKIFRLVTTRYRCS